MLHRFAIRATVTALAYYGVAGGCYGIALRRVFEHTPLDDLLGLVITGGVFMVAAEVCRVRACLERTRQEVGHGPPPR